MIVLRDMVNVYPDLRVVLMSATVDTTLFTNYFGNCSVIVLEGRNFPVQRMFFCWRCLLLYEATGVHMIYYLIVKYC